VKGCDLYGESEQDIGHADSDLGNGPEGGQGEPSTQDGMVSGDPSGGDEAQDHAVAKGPVEDVKALDSGPGWGEFSVHACRPLRADEAGVVRGNEASENDLDKEQAARQGREETPCRLQSWSGPRRRGKPGEPTTQEDQRKGEGISGH
jgi:hypothetical protein